MNPASVREKSSIDKREKCSIRYIDPFNVNVKHSDTLKESIEMNLDILTSFF
jgi:hypothetical protein